MIFDYLRSGYVAKVRWQQGGTGEINIRWLPAKPGAKIFPHRTAFVSSVWQPDYLPNLGVGEVDRTRVWSPNKASILAGDHFEGDPQWFLTGVPREHWNDPPVNCGVGNASVGVHAPLGMTVALEPLVVAGVRPDCSLGMTVALGPLEVVGVRPDCSLGMTVALGPLEVVPVRPDCSLGITVAVDVFVVPAVLPDCSFGVSTSVIVL